MWKSFNMKQYLSVGFISKPHGVKGLVKVEPLTDDVTRFKNMKHVFIEEAGIYVKYRISERSIAPAYALLKLEGIDTPEEAEKYRNKTLWIERSQTRKLEKDEYFWVDLIGLDVFYSDNGKKLGKLDDIIATYSNDVYVVKTSKQDVLIPALKEYVTVDMDKGAIFVHRKGLEEILPDED